MTPTPRPWRIDIGREVGLRVYAANHQVLHDQRDPDELEIRMWLEIVRAVNTLEEMREALTALVEVCDKFSTYSDLAHSRLKPTTIKAKAVLAKLEGT